MKGRVGEDGSHSTGVEDVDHVGKRPSEQLDKWLSEIEADLQAYREARPGAKVAPHAVNLIVHRKVFDEQFQVARHAEMVLVSGKVEREGDVIHVLARQFQRLTLPSLESLPAASRDFH